MWKATLAIWENLFKREVEKKIQIFNSKTEEEKKDSKSWNVRGNVTGK